MSVFTQQSQPKLPTIKLPNSENQHRSTFTINGQPALIVQREFIDQKPIGPVRVNKRGKPLDQWRIPVLDQDGTESQVFIASPGMKEAIGKAMLAEGIDTFHQGDVYSIEYAGKKVVGGTRMNDFKVELQHNGGEAYEADNQIESSMSAAQDQAVGAYAQSQQAPPAPAGYPSQPPQQGFPQPPAAPGGQQYPPQSPGYGGYGQAPQGYPAAPPAPPQDDNPWG